MPVDVRAFSHVALPVSDLEASLRFYRDVLGLEVVLRVSPDDSDTAGGIAGGLRIAGVLVPGGPMLEMAEGMPGKLDSSYVVALGVADVKAAQREIEAAGLTPSMPPTEVVPGVTMMFVSDPDGRTIELVEFATGAVSNYENLRAKGDVS